MYDESEINVNTSEDRKNVDQYSKIKRIREIISSNSGKSLRAGKECIQDYRSVSSCGYNKKSSHCEVTKTSASPISLDIDSSKYLSFDINASSYDKDELEIRTTQANDRTKVDQESKDIGTSKIFSSNSGKNIRTGKYFIKTYSRKAQHSIETITSFEAQVLTNTAPQHYDGPDFITNTDIS